MTRAFWLPGGSGTRPCIAESFGPRAAPSCGNATGDSCKPWGPDKIELREKARQSLGERFSLKGFHNAVLTAGTLPIDMLEREVDTYIQNAARR
jgi:hypothetical protein